LLVLASALPHLTRLGFASDDWAFLAVLRFAEDQSFVGLVRAQTENPNLVGRPTQYVLQALLYLGFGMNPLGYHVVNGTILAASAALLHRGLLRLGVAPALAAASAVLWGLSPAYVADRLWFAAFGYVIAVAAALGSILADLRATDGPRISWWWKSLAVVLLAVSVLSMEIAVPALALWQAVLLWSVRRRHGAWPHRLYGTWRSLVAFGGGGTIFVLLMAFKAQHAVGAGPGTGFGLIRHIGRLVLTAVGVQLGSYGLLLPHSVWWALQRAETAGLVAALAIGIAALFLFRRVVPEHGVPRAESQRFLVAGLVVFALGWSIFLTTSRFSFTSTGIETRMGIGGAVGASMLVVGSVTFGASMVPTRMRRDLTAGILAAVCAGFALITLTVSSYWVRATGRAEELADRLAVELEDRDFDVVLLAGQCPYLGPAVVFESSWDLHGALAVRLGRSDFLADVVTRRASPQDGAITIPIYEWSATYRLTEGTLVLAVTESGVQEVDPQWAVAVAGTCPEGREGHGVDQLWLDRNLPLRWRHYG
jgi:hypothetical protein